MSSRMRAVCCMSAVWCGFPAGSSRSLACTGVRNHACACTRVPCMHARWAPQLTALPGPGPAPLACLRALQEMRQQREIWERNRPMTDEELDAILPGGWGWGMGVGDGGWGWGWG